MRRGLQSGPGCGDWSSGFPLTRLAVEDFQSGEIPGTLDSSADDEKLASGVDLVPDGSGSQGPPGPVKGGPRRPLISFRVVLQQ